MTLNLIAKVVISDCLYNSITSESAKVSKMPRGLSASINIKGDFAEFVDGFLLALVDYMEIFLRHLDAAGDKEGRKHFLAPPAVWGVTAAGGGGGRKKVIGYAKKHREVKIKRKSFEMNGISAFCQVEKMQTATEY